MAQDVKDICLEFEDDGFSVKVYSHPSESVLHIRVSNGYDIYLKDPRMKHLIDVVDRIRECCKLYGFKSVDATEIPSKDGSTTSEVPPGGFLIIIRAF